MKKITTLLIVLLLTITNIPNYTEVGGTITRSTNKQIPIYIEEELINYDVGAEKIDGKLMIPLRFTLEEYGFEVKWNNEGKSVEMINGAQYSKIIIGENTYIKNKMIPFKLSSSPTIKNSRTLVPIEFFHEVFNITFKKETNSIIFDNEDNNKGFVTHIGTVKEINNNEGFNSYHISTKNNDEIDVVIHTNKNTIIQREIKVGETIHSISLPIMAMSYPGQTGSIVIY